MFKTTAIQTSSITFQLLSDFGEFFNSIGIEISDSVIISDAKALEISEAIKSKGQKPELEVLEISNLFQGIYDIKGQKNYTINELWSIRELNILQVLYASKAMYRSLMEVIMDDRGYPSITDNRNEDMKVSRVSIITKDTSVSLSMSLKGKSYFDKEEEPKTETLGRRRIQFERA